MSDLTAHDEGVFTTDTLSLSNAEVTVAPAAPVIAADIIEGIVSHGGGCCINLATIVFEPCSNRIERRITHRLHLSRGARRELAAMLSNFVPSVEQSIE